MGLLNKLASGKGNSDDALVNSIVANINHVLSTTRDYGFFLHDFGLSDYKYLCTHEDIEKVVIDEIAKNIERFEPRVILKTIENINEDKFFRLSFQINCVVRNTGQPLTLFLKPMDDRYQIAHD